MECPVCREMVHESSRLNAGASRVRCAACGIYDISDAAETMLSQLDDHHRIHALRYAQTNALAGRHPYIHGIA